MTSEAMISTIGEVNVMQPVQVEIQGPIGVGQGKLHSEGIPDTERFTQSIQRNMVKVDPRAPGVCIDGRKCSHCFNQALAMIGPKSAGGPLISAYAAVELVGGWYPDEVADASSEVRLKTVADHIESVKDENGDPVIVLGAHCDGNAYDAGFKDPEGKPKTGCGADDNAPAIMQIIHSDAGNVVTISNSLLGGAPHADPEFTSATVLEARHVDWDATNMLKIVDNEEGPGNIEILPGQHGEVAVLFNYVEGMTLDRDAFVQETGMQVFVVDMWYLDKIARVLATGPNADQQYPKLLRALVSFQVGTYIKLCDGSHNAVIAKEDQLVAA